MAMDARFEMMVLVGIAIAALLQSSAAQTTHVVGDALGWVIPPGGSAAYTTWAASKSFAVGDTLVFNFTSGVHDVAQITKADYDACNTGNPILKMTSSPARIALNTTGEHYFVCTFTGHCSAGQKLAINVTAAASSPAPEPASFPSPAPEPAGSNIPSPVPAPQPATASPAPEPASSNIPSPVPAPQPATSSPPQPAASSPAPQAGSPSEMSAPTPAPSRSPVTHTVGDTLGWTIPTNGATAYERWARGKTFMVGDVLVFNYINGTHDVAEMTKQAYDSCNTASTLSVSGNPPTRITLTTPGQHYFTCTVPTHCSSGQKLAITVTGSSTATPPSSSTVPSALSPGGVAAPPTPGNFASSLGVTGLSTTVLSLLVAFFMY